MRSLRKNRDGHPAGADATCAAVLRLAGLDLLRPGDRPCSGCVRPCSCRRQSPACACSCTPDCEAAPGHLLRGAHAGEIASSLPLAFAVAAIARGRMRPAELDGTDVRLWVLPVVAGLLATALTEAAREAALPGRWELVVATPDGAACREGLWVTLRRRGDAPPIDEDEYARLAGALGAPLRRAARAAADELCRRVVDDGRGADCDLMDLARAVPGVVHLTRRERQTFSLFLQGYSVASIGQIMGISPFTVRNHLKNLFPKLEVESQKDLREVFAARAVYWRS